MVSAMAQGENGFNSSWSPPLNIAVSQGFLMEDQPKIKVYEGNG